jgi:hypothetical protein
MEFFHFPPFKYADGGKKRTILGTPPLGNNTHPERRGATQAEPQDQGAMAGQQTAYDHAQGWVKTEEEPIPPLFLATCAPAGSAVAPP